MTNKDDLINFLIKTEIPDDLDSKKESKIVSDIFKYCWDLTPENLYRYRSCNENNFNALEGNRFLLSKPTLFNDPYDSLLFINREKIINDLTNDNDYDVVEKLKNDTDF